MFGNFFNDGSLDPAVNALRAIMNKKVETLNMARGNEICLVYSLTTFLALVNWTAHTHCPHDRHERLLIVEELKCLETAMYTLLIIRSTEKCIQFPAIMMELRVKNSEKERDYYRSLLCVEEITEPKKHLDTLFQIGYLSATQYEQLSVFTKMKRARVDYHSVKY